MSLLISDYSIRPIIGPIIGIGLVHFYNAEMINRVLLLDKYRADRNMDSVENHVSHICATVELIPLYVSLSSTWSRGSTVRLY